MPYPRVVVRPVNVHANANANANANTNTNTNAHAHAHVNANVNVTVRVNAQVAVPTPPRPPRPPEPAVALQGAPVVEFFGIPLEGAESVVFVLDCSGSMTDLAQGRIAQISSQDGTLGSPPDGPLGSPPDGTQGSPPDGAPADPQDGAPADPSAPAPAPAPPPAPPAPTKIDVAREELVDALRRLPAGTYVEVIFFNSEVEALAPGLVPLEDAGREGMIAHVREMTANGRTALTPAMRTAFLMNAKRIVLLSDGMGNVGGDSRDLLRDAREAMRGGVRIDAIGLGRDQDAALLQTLAAESGGIYQAL